MAIDSSKSFFLSFATLLETFSKKSNESMQCLTRLIEVIFTFLKMVNFSFIKVYSILFFGHRSSIGECGDIGGFFYCIELTKHSSSIIFVGTNLFALLLCLFKPFFGTLPFPLKYFLQIFCSIEYSSCS